MKKILLALSLLSVSCEPLILDKCKCFEIQLISSDGDVLQPEFELTIMQESRVLKSFYIAPEEFNSQGTFIVYELEDGEYQFHFYWHERYCQPRENYQTFSANVSLDSKRNYVRITGIDALRSCI